MEEKDKSKQRRKPDETPIVDGDARPDQLDEERIKKRISSEKKKAPFTSNRGGDVNSLEDYKDER